ncbi:MAG: metallophosphoesterase [Firmicutes bacterium]|nr:metallophosphoesterase [Bacillota bacterium]
MSLFAIADLHLSLGSAKPMDIFGGWENHVSRLEENWRRVIAGRDTVVIAGDISWAMSLQEAKRDFAFLESLPGQKILMKGNHDYWWSTRKKMDAFLTENGFSTLRILHNCAYSVGGVSVCGTRGWFYDAEEDADKKILNREVGRLKTSLADAAPGTEPVVFLHYPPVFGGERCEEFLTVLREQGIRRCYYGHLHGPSIRRAVTGDYGGTQLRLISGDAVGFLPVLVEKC